MKILLETSGYVLMEDSGFVLLEVEQAAVAPYRGVKFSSVTSSKRSRSKPAPGKFGSLVKYVWTRNGRIPSKRK